MPSPTDDSDRPTLPRPELNPLLNPLLSANMGRWAEAYFTSPPEKREEAVLKLIDELKAQESSQRPPSAQMVDLPSFASQSPPPHPPERAALTLPDLTLVESHEWPDRDPRDSASIRISYWIGAGLIVAIAALVLGYMAWRGTHVESRGSVPPSAPSAPANPSAIAPQPSRASGIEIPQQKSPVSNMPAVPLQDKAAADTRRGSEKLPAAAPAATPPMETSPGAASSPNGSLDLAIAKSYLNGTEGHVRDSAEAVKWLWQAVGKQNAEATMLLSDIYLRGDGVPKNCEQARLLLDAAARKGLKEAGERLQHLQDFGCE